MRQPAASLLAGGIKAPLLPVRSGRTWPCTRTTTTAHMGMTLPGAAMADPKQHHQQRPRPRLPETEVLLHGVRVDLARRPSGEPLTPLIRPRVRFGFAKICRVRVSSSCRRPPHDFSIGFQSDSVAEQIISFSQQAWQGMHR
jgi:hypothetical protein